MPLIDASSASIASIDLPIPTVASEIPPVSSNALAAAQSIPDSLLSTVPLDAFLPSDLQPALNEPKIEDYIAVCEQQRSLLTCAMQCTELHSAAKTLATLELRTPGSLHQDPQAKVKDNVDEIFANRAVASPSTKRNSIHHRQSRSMWKCTLLQYSKHRRLPPQCKHSTSTSRNTSVPSRYSI